MKDDQAAKSLFLITGCSGGGKSTLLRHLQNAGYQTVEEPGTRIFREATSQSSETLPWNSMSAFAKRALEIARADLKAASSAKDPVFFDRGLIDAAVALCHETGARLEEFVGNKRDYAKLVFLAPPWPEIFANDDMRRHDFASAVSEYERICRALEQLGYEMAELPKVSVAVRAAYLTDRIIRME